MEITPRDIIDLLIGLAAGVAITFTYQSVTNTKTNSTDTRQSNNVVGGDQAGRDIKK